MKIRLLHTIENKGKTHLLGTVVELDEELTRELLEREIAVVVDQGTPSIDTREDLPLETGNDDGFSLEDQAAEISADNEHQFATVEEKTGKTGGSKKGK